MSWLPWLLALLGGIGAAWLLSLRASRADGERIERQRRELEDARRRNEIARRDAEQRAELEAAIAAAVDELDEARERARLDPLDELEALASRTEDPW